MLRTSLPALFRRVITETDAALLEQFARGDEAAFAALVERHGPMVLGVCRRTLGDRHTAEDACQATFLVLARKVATVRPGELAAWLHGVARRTALRARTSAHQPLTDLPARGRDPLDELTGRELLAILEDEIQRLPTAYRLPVTLCCVEGLTQEEAARRLNTTQGSIRGRVERGRSRLHARLSARGCTPASVLALAGFACGTVPNTTYTAASRMLAEGVVRAMFLTKIKVLAAILLLAACGMGVITVQPGHAVEQPKKPAPVIAPLAATPDTPDWGEPDGRVQLRLRPDKAVWLTTESPSFTLDMRLVPEGFGSELVDFGYVQRVEIDGEEYEADPVSRKSQSMVYGTHRHLLVSGQEARAVDALSLCEFRAVKAANRPLTLKSGKHTVRVSALVTLPQGFVRPWSQSVVMEIKEDEGTKKPEPPEWGEAMEGMQCRLHADRLVWAAGEWPSFKADVRYRSDRPAGQERIVWLGDTQDYFSVEIDGQWFHPTAQNLPVPKVPFPTGGDKAGVPIATKAGWQDNAGKPPAALAVGKHTVRVALKPLHRDSGPVMRAVSKSVEIEVRGLAADAIRGKWQVVKEERPDAARAKWVERAVRPGDSFTFLEGTVAWSGENSYGLYTLLLDEEKKTIEMRSLAVLGIADVRVGRYRLEGDELTLCFGEERKVPADFTPKAPAARLYHLKRMTLDLRDASGKVIVPAYEISAYDWATHTLELKPGAVAKLQQAYSDGKNLAVPFLVAVGGDTVYRGEITAMGSSQSCKGVVILLGLPGGKKDSVTLQLGYPGERSFQGKDPRDDASIKAVLTGSGKLK